MVERRVRARREARGLSQIGLAATVGLSRQSLAAIEAGRATPSVDVALRIAGALGARVEDLFGEGGAPETIAAVVAGVGPGSRVALATVAGRIVAFPMGRGGLRASADGLTAGAQASVPAAEGATISVTPLRGRAAIDRNLVLVGCATALGLLVDRLHAQPGAGRFLWIEASSTQALRALSARTAHVGGVHLTDRRSREPNVTDVRRHVRADPLVLVTLARWEAGLVVPRGNPRRLRGAADLGRRGLRLASREVGSGARRLLDGRLAEAGLDPSVARGVVEARGHLEVAQAVALGACDVGVATRDVAIACDLGFVALAEERYDLAIPAALLDDERVARLLDALTAAAFRRELTALGYDTRSSGARVADVAAA
jgi:molybdate-binding protein/DNA-binding XRE family transcriptional regulator